MSDYKDKEKVREYAHEYYLKNKEKVREYAHEYYLKNKEKYKNWRENNAERDKERIRKWNEKNAEHIKEYHLKWRVEHPEYRKQKSQRAQDKYHNDPEFRKREIQRVQDKYRNDPAFRGRRLFYRYKRFDIEKNVAPADPSEYPTLEEVNEMLLQPCVWCGESDWHKIGLDRKDNRFGHVRGNLQPCCKWCNDKKEKRSNEEFRQAINDGRIKLKAVKVVKTDADTAAIPAMPTMRSLLI